MRPSIQFTCPLIFLLQIASAAGDINFLQSEGVAANSFGSFGNAAYPTVQQAYGASPYIYSDGTAPVSSPLDSSALLSARFKTAQANAQLLENNLAQTARYAALVSRHAASVSREMQQLSEALHQQTGSPTGSAFLSPARQGAELFDQTTPVAGVLDTQDAGLQSYVPVTDSLGTNAREDMAQFEKDLRAVLNQEDASLDVNSTLPEVSYADYDMQALGRPGFSPSPNPQAAFLAVDAGKVDGDVRPNIVELHVSANGASDPGSNNTNPDLKCGGEMQTACGDFEKYATFDYHLTMTTGILTWIIIILLLCCACSAVVYFFFRGIIFLVLLVLLIAIVWVMKPWENM